MKKDYLKPEIISVAVVTENFLASSDNSLPGGDEDVIPTAGKNRGEWGNVWGK